jgi:hypothetical protein
MLHAATRLGLLFLIAAVARSQSVSDRNGRIFFTDRQGVRKPITDGKLDSQPNLSIAVSGFAAFQKSLRAVRSRAESAFRSSGGDAEGWIAGLACLARLAGSTAPPGLVQGIAKRCGIPLERVPELTEKGFPDSGDYPVPDFERDSLVLVS